MIHVSEKQQAMLPHTKTWVCVECGAEEVETQRAEEELVGCLRQSVAILEQSSLVFLKSLNHFWKMTRLSMVFFPTLSKQMLGLCFTFTLLVESVFLTSPLQKFVSHGCIPHF